VITLEELKEICPQTKLASLEKFVDALNAAMLEFNIDNPVREAAFLAQVAHESGGFNYVREIASGDAYEGRVDLGNIYPGDGRKFRGHGLIQITGRSNHHECSMALFGDLRLLDNPALLEHPTDAARSAAWFWEDRGLNEIADKGDFKLITKRINGGYNGFSERVAYYERAKEALA